MILRNISSILRYLIRDDSLRNTIRGRSFGQQLCVAGIVQREVEEGRLVDSSAHGEKTILFR